MHETNPRRAGEGGRMSRETVAEYLARIGAKGGKATGARKRRTPQQYADMAAKSVASRKAKRKP